MAGKISLYNNTKKEMIAKMLLDNDNKYSAREIARSVGTTEGNVFKEKSRLKATGILSDRKLSFFSHSVGDETLTLARAEAKTLVTLPDFASLTKIPPLKPEDLKKLYAEFQNGMTPVQVIAENGFNPMIVEYEHNRFRRMNSLNLKSLVHELIEAFRLDKNELSDPLIQKTVRDGITSNEDIRKLIEIISNSSYSKGELSVIERMRNGDSIGTFKPLTCSICGGPMRGAMVEPDREIGRKVLESIGSGAAHDKCLKGDSR
ncbi:MAG: hypothetical protein ACRD8W_09045 [Nitrososphaeraceae archaeon]